MTSKEILHEIVLTEHKARTLYADAVKRQEGFAEQIENKKTAIREKEMQRAQEDIEQLEKKLIAESDKLINEQNEKYARLADDAKKMYENGRESLIAKLFTSVVRQDA